MEKWGRKEGGIITAITPSKERFSLLMFWRTCSKLWLWSVVSIEVRGGGGRELTMAISERSASRCWWKGVLVGGGAEGVCARAAIGGEGW